MNKFLKLTILIVVAAGVIFSLDWLSGPGEIIPPGGVSPNTTEKKFEAKCKQLGSKPWDKNSFEAIKDELHTYGQQGVITNEEAARFEGYLYTNYSNSLNTSFSKWLTNNCDDEVNNLYKELQTVAGVGEYKLILSNSIEIAEKYFAVTSLPARVTQHISSEFMESLHESIVMDINNLCQTEGLSKCNKIQIIKSEQLAIMEAFKSFSKAYIDAYNTAKINLNDAYYTNDLKQFCPENNEEINKYNFYLNQIKNIDICY